MNPLQSFQATVIPPLSEDKWNEAIMNVADAWGEEIEAEFKHVYPDYVISPGTRLKPREQYERFRQLLMEAYTTEMGIDMQGLMNEFNWLLRDDYIDHIWAGADMLDQAFRQGGDPVMIEQVMMTHSFPRALPWAKLWAIRWAFTDIQKVFQKLVKENAA